VEVGAKLGYRLDLGQFGIAALLGPAVAAVSQELRQGTGGQTEVVDPKTGTLMAPPGRDARITRLNAALRATLVASEPLLVFAALDASFDVARDAANDMPAQYAGTAALPTWSAGLSFGAQLRVWP
jgi:hypothetical protein